MPVHDWTRVEDGIFHDFHTVWVAEIRNALNAGLLPPDYYALTEQHAGRYIADVLTLHSASNGKETSPAPSSSGGTALAEARPSVRRSQVIEPAMSARRRTLAIRHVSGHRMVALIEIVSPANKDRRDHLKTFAAKAASALDFGVNVLVVDLFPPGLHDPQGIHGIIQRRINRAARTYDLPADEPLTLASYVAGPRVEVFLEHLAVGGALPPMPLFLNAERYVNVPLETSYQIAFDGLAPFWRQVLLGN